MAVGTRYNIRPQIVDEVNSNELMIRKTEK